MTSDDTVARLLVRHVVDWAAAHGPGLVVGVGGPQGSGKSTACAAAAGQLEARGLRTAVLALDDLYLPLAARRRLARETHPLLLTRGPPGTHDTALGLHLLDELRRPGAVQAPRFSKAHDDRGPSAPAFAAPADVVLFEGWCVGARPEPAERLAAPLNALEREEDTDGRWRAGVNRRLAGDYAALWARIDRLVLLTAPGWPTTCAWRAEAEEGLRARGGGMTPAALVRFMDHYQRLTLWIAQDLPGRADLVIRLDGGRRPRDGA